MKNLQPNQVRKMKKKDQQLRKFLINAELVLKITKILTFYNKFA